MTKQYIKCSFYENRNKDEVITKINQREIPQNHGFPYLGSTIQNNKMIDKDMCNRIKADWTV